MDRIPLWFKCGLPDAQSLKRVMGVISSLDLNTICFEARCPNKGDCFSKGSVTFLILGRHCTRRCGFCNVTTAEPEDVDCSEPQRIVEACRELELDYVILTSVTRDDLPDGGSGHFAECVGALRANGAALVIEALTPDFAGDTVSVDRVASAGVDVFGHNVETVERLYPRVRERADYRRSLEILSRVRRRFPEVIIKSGLMLGLGESKEEVRSTIRDLADAGCDIITVGQYLRPSREHLRVRDYVHPAVFTELERYAHDLGTIAVCGPRVRSSYLARAAYDNARLRRQRCA
jgi:lipoic acid synthetase